MTARFSGAVQASGAWTGAATPALIPCTVSVVVPVYSDGASLHELVTRTAATLRSLGSPQWEILLVNDESPGQCWALVEDLCRREANVRGINLMRNYGQHNALLCGIRAARHEVIVTMDDDLQHPPEEIPKLLDQLSQGYDVVYGTPLTEQHGFLRNLAAYATKLALQGAIGVDIARQVSAFRAFRTQVRDAFAGYRSPFLSIDVLLTWGSRRFAAARVQHRPRQAGVSSYTLGKLVAHALNMLTGFSTLPLQLASLMGFTLTLFGLAVLLYVLGRWIIQGSLVPGFPFLASVITIFSGAQLFALGIIGEYLARMHFRMMERPTYTVRNTTFSE